MDAADGRPRKKRKTDDEAPSRTKKSHSETSKHSGAATTDDRSLKTTASERSQSPRDEPEPAANGERPKKTKTKRSKKHGDGERSNASVAAAEDEEMEAPQTEEDRIRERKEKKERKKAKKRELAEQELRSPSPDPLAKHKSILARRAASQSLGEGLSKDEEAKDVVMEDAAAPVLHPLQPLPQPAPRPEKTELAAISVLPSWLEKPIKVSATARSSFEELGIDQKTVEALHAKGWADAFAVQSAVLPLLLPGPRHKPGDVLVSAATGSGKTLSYVLPIIRDVSRTATTRLRALIVLPTRELVSQAREVCEVCASAFAGRHQRRAKIGVAVGSTALKTEQGVLMEQTFVLDPAAYAAKVAAQNAKWETSSAEGDASDDLTLFEDESGLARPGHVLEFTSAVDVLICTPGRLVEHLKSTPSFTLDHVKWLVIDEADRLLDQSFQQWLETVMAQLPPVLPARRDKRLTKVILSATLTRDVGQLSSLKLYRPKMVILEGSDKEQANGKMDSGSDALVIPDSLKETATKVEDDGEKPLYLLRLLHMALGKPDAGDASSSSDTSNSSDDSDDSSGDADDSSDDSEDSSAASRGDSTPDSSDSDSDSDTESDSESDRASGESGSEALEPQKSTRTSEPRGVLIFTKSNEATLRLSRLLSLLEPVYASRIGTLTSTVRNSKRRTTIHAFRTGKLAIIVASDLVARGLDLPDLAHVINYDMPSSLTSYVHRVGRTARAGKRGTAWTLFTNTEGGWFWNNIARSAAVTRAAKVTRVNIDPASWGDELRSQYETALQALGRETESGGARKPTREL